MGILTKNENYFNKGIENFIDNLMKCNVNDSPVGNRFYKNSLKEFGQILYEESIGKNGKKEDEILEYDFKNYERYTYANWNAFFLRNSLHQIFSSKSNKISLDNAYKKIIELSPELDDYESKTNAKFDISHYFNVFETFGIIKDIKTFSDDNNKEILI